MVQALHRFVQTMIRAALCVVREDASGVHVAREIELSCLVAIQNEHRILLQLRDLLLPSLR